MARRTARRRRARRLTPRRWLPFVALIALVVGAVMVSSEEPTAPPERIAPVLDTSRMPAVGAADAIASTWYCGGGTATGEGGTAELSLLLANDDRRGAVAEVTFMGAAGKEATTQVDVPAHGRARVRASEILEAEWVGAVVEVRGGRVGVDREVTGPLGFDASPCSSVASDHWFVASGSTVRGSQQYLSLFNPFPDAASVSISFATDSGRRTPRSLRALSIPGRSVRTIEVGSIITNRSEVATTVVTRSGRVVVDRVQTYDGQGEAIGTGPDASPPEGLVSTAATPVRAPRWIFPAARVSAGVETQIAVYNPGSKTAEVDVALTYEDPKLNPEIEPIALTIRPREQALVSLNDVPGIVSDLDAWVDVRSLDGVPVVAERLSFFSDPSPRSGATATAGSPIAATDWMVTQAGATRARTTTVQVVNPGDTSARVTVITLSEGDRDVLESASVVISGGDRRSLVVEGAGAAATVIVHSSKPVVVASSLSMADGPGISVQPGLPFPETVVALPPVS
ncbi:DUF5719 family protein [Aquihabitans daechungensis]|uniref:DUF5719 family protein n=1 Tax=Aquihabitans daechungensis TaxID=1052257 RepID=UPI003BA1F256